MEIDPWLQTIMTIVCSVVASSGFWTFIQKKNENKDAKSQMLLGLGHDRIMTLATKYIERGWITHDEYENLNDYLFKPYVAMGGNGSAKHIMAEVDKLPIHAPSYIPN